MTLLSGVGSAAAYELPLHTTTRASRDSHAGLTSGALRVLDACIEIEILVEILLIKVG